MKNKTFNDIQHQDRTKIKKLDISVKLEEVIFICYLFKFIAKNEKNLEEHALIVHGIVKSFCNKCEYVAEDEEILANHMKKHTDEILFSCYKCEFEATREYILENHNERKHTQNKT